MGEPFSNFATCAMLRSVHCALVCPPFPIIGILFEILFAQYFAVQYDLACFPHKRLTKNYCGSRFELTFDVVPQDGSVVVLSWVDCERCCCISFTTRVSGDDFDFAAVDVATLRNVKVPHTVVNQLMFATLLSQKQSSLD